MALYSTEVPPSPQSHPLPAPAPKPPGILQLRAGNPTTDTEKLGVWVVEHWQVDVYGRAHTQRIGRPSGGGIRNSGPY